MDKFKTIVIQDSQIIKENYEDNIILTEDWIEIVPKDKIFRYLKLNVIFKGYKTTTQIPYIKINGELCPIMIQEDFEIVTDDRLDIQSLQLNQSFGCGHMIMIECDNHK